MNASTAYNIGIAHLINNPGDREGAYNAIETFIVKLESDSEELKNWWKDIEDWRLPPAQVNMGWVKIGFVDAINYLNSDISFEDSL